MLKAGSITLEKKLRVRSSRGLVKISSGAALFHDLALVHEDHGVRDVAGEAHLVGDDDQRGAGLGEFADDVQDLVDQFRVQGRRGLVEEQDLGVQGQRPGDRHALLLAAGELARVGAGAVLQAHPVQQFQAALAGLRLGSRGFRRGATTGASVTFSSAVRCGKRLKFWNTMPISVRCFRIVLFAQLVERAAADLVAHQRRRRWR